MPRASMSDADAPAPADRLAAPGREPGSSTVLLTTSTPSADLEAWLGALAAEESDTAPEATEAIAGELACREADELLLALAEVRASHVERALPQAKSPSAAHAPPRRRRVAGTAPRFDSRALAERLLAESQREAVLHAEPAELLSAQLGTNAISEDLLARLLEGLVGAPLGDDEASATGPLEQGLLALLALQLYVQEARRRDAPRGEVSPLAERVKAPAHGDPRLLEVLAVPHAASRPLGERRPRGRPRR